MPPRLPGLESGIEAPFEAILDDPGQPPIETRESGVVVVDRFPFGLPGVPIAVGPCESATVNTSSPLGPEDSIWAPFRSERDWEIAHWAKTRGPTSSALTDLLAIPEVCARRIYTSYGANLLIKVVERLGISYRTARELNSIIDNELPASGQPPFQCKEVLIGKERLEFFYRDTLKCIAALYGDPDLVQDLVFAPERHYTNDKRTCRLVNEMHTGDWWWDIQVRNCKLQTKIVA